MKKAIVKIEIEYDFPNFLSDENIMLALENLEQPNSYRENSWEFIKIIKES